MLTNGIDVSQQCTRQQDFSIYPNSIQLCPYQLISQIALYLKNVHQHDDKLFCWPSRSQKSLSNEGHVSAIWIKTQQRDDDALCLCGNKCTKESISRMLIVSFIRFLNKFCYYTSFKKDNKLQSVKYMQYSSLNRKKYSYLHLYTLFIPEIQ